MSSDHSGTGNGESGILTALQAASNNGCLRMPRMWPRLYSVCDCDPASQKVLKELVGEATFVFGDLRAQVPWEVLCELQDMLPSQDDTVDAKRAAFKAIINKMQANLDKCLPEDRTQKDLRTGRFHRVFFPQWDAAMPSPITVLVSGTECQAWSRMNQKGEKDTADSFFTFIVWAMVLRQNRYVLAVHENVLAHDMSLLESLVGDLCLARIQQSCALLCFLTLPPVIHLFQLTVQWGSLGFGLCALLIFSFPALQFF